MYVVEVTWGTHPREVYARTDLKADAEKLKLLAVSLGYRDAKVYREAPEAQRGVSRVPGRPR